MRADDSWLQRAAYTERRTQSAVRSRADYNHQFGRFQPASDDEGAHRSTRHQAIFVLRKTARPTVAGRRDDARSERGK